MKNNIGLVICNHYKNEAETIIKNEQFEDVELLTYPGYCINYDVIHNAIDEIIRTRKEDFRKIIILGAGCLRESDFPPLPENIKFINTPQCFYMFCNKSIMDEYLKENGCPISTGWFENWKDNIKDIVSNYIAGKTINKILILDTNVHEKNEDKYEELAKSVNLPYEIVPVGLDYFNLYLSKIIFDIRIDRCKDAINVSRQIEEQLQQAVITDDLTGLFNRRGFFTLAEKQFQLSQRTKKPFSLLYLDIDGFKTINDEIGHTAGDQVLQATAKILKKAFRESDIIARIGGDEFVILMTELSDHNIEQIIITNIRKRLNEFNEYSGQPYKLSFSIGVIYYDPEDKTKVASMEDLMKEVDMLMYEDKKRHKKLKIIRPPLRSERRIYKRFNTGQRIKTLLSGIIENITVKDISPGGLCINTSRPLPFDNIYNTKISTETGEEISQNSLVVWSAPVKTDNHFAGFETGLKFLNLNEEFKISIEKLMEILE